MPVAVPVLGAGGVPVLVLPIILVLVAVLVPGSAPIRVRLIMLVRCSVPVLVPLIMLVVPCIVPILVPLIMLAVVPSMMPILVPLIMLVLIPWPHAVEGPGEGLPRGLVASAVEAPMAIMPAAKAPASRGRLKAVTFCRRALTVPISLLYQAVIVDSFLICPFLRDTCRLPQRCSGCGQDP
jgi:hypothetical protein